MTDEKENKKEMPKWPAYVWEVTKVVVISLIIVIPVRTFLMQPYYVQQESMMPNFQPNNYLIVNRWTMRSDKIERGDVVVFKIPTEKDALIKRVIGQPGEHVEVKEREVFINGEQLDESAYLASDVETWGSVDVTLGDNEYFAMGDNRNHSMDSRHFGVVHKDQIVGRAALRLFPPSMIERFGPVSYSKE